MNKLLVFFLISNFQFSSFSCFSQLDELKQKQLDSLNVILNNESSHDTSLAATYVAISDILYVSNLDTVYPLCIKAKNMAESRLALTKNAKEIKSYKQTLAGALNNIGYVTDIQGSSEQAFGFYHQSLLFYTQIDHKTGISDVSNNLAVIYESLGNIKKSLEHYELSLKIRDELNDTLGIIQSHSNLGSLYRSQGDFEKSFEYFTKSIALSEKINDKRSLANALNQMGVNYEHVRNYEKALPYFEKSLEINLELGDQLNIAVLYNNIGLCYDRLVNPEMGLVYFNKGLEISKNENDLYGIVNVMRNICETYFEKGDLIKAREIGEENYLLAQKLGFPLEIRNAAKCMYLISKKEKKYDEALGFFETFVQLKDSIKNEETQKATIRQQTKYEFEKGQILEEQKRNEELRIQHEELQRRNQLQYSIILIALLTLFAIVLFALPRVSPLWGDGRGAYLAEGLIFFSFLILFEFLLVLADPYVDNWTDGAPGWKLLLNAGIAAGIFPLHAFFEKKLKRRLPDKIKV